MACKIPNADELVNLLENKKNLYETSSKDTYDDIETRLNHTRQTVKLNPTADQYHLDVGIRGDYKFDTRVTTLVKKILKKDYSDIDPVFSEVGTVIHKYMEKLLKDEPVDMTTNGWEISDQVLSMLRETAQGIKDYAKRRQDQVDKTKEPKFFIEQTLANAKQSRAGTADLIVVFSDKTAMVFDFKSMIVSSKDFDTNERFVNRERLSRRSKEFELQLSLLASDLKNYGVTDIIGGRIVPLPVLIDSTYDPKTKKFITKKKIKRMDSPFKEGSAFGQLMLLTEKTKVKNIDTFISKQFQRIRKLEETKKEEDRAAAEALRVEAEEIVMNHNFSVLINNIRTLWEDYEKRKDELKYFASGKQNKKYYTDDELVELYSKIKSAGLMFDSMGDYYRKLENSQGFKEKTGKEKADEIRSLIGKFTQESQMMISEIDGLITKRFVGGIIGEDVLDDQGRVKVQRGEGVITNALFGLGDQQNHILRAINELKIENERKVSEGLEEFIQKWAKINNDVNKWINQNGRKRFVQMMVNPKTKNLISQLKKEFFDEAKKQEDLGNLDWIKQHYEPREGYTEEEFKKRKKTFESNLKLQNLSQKDIDARLRSFDERFNLWSPIRAKAFSAWTNKKIVKIKSSVFSDKQWLTDEYKAIMGTPLEDFYKFYKEHMSEFLRMVDRPDVPGNFIPWIRQGLIEGFLNDGFSTKALKNAALHSVVARNDISYLSHDEFGRLEQEVPVYFMNPATDEKGEVIPGEDKSMDLMKSLLVFGKMAIAHKAAKENVGVANLLLEVYNNQMFYETTTRGNLKKSGTGFATRPITAIEKETAEALRDYHWYGIDMRSKDATFDVGGRQFSMIELTRTLKNNWTIMTLSFGLKQALGGYVSARINAWIDGAKGVYYSTEQFNNGVKMYYSDFSKVSALGLYMDVYTDDLVDRKLKAVGLDPMDKGKFRANDFIRSFKNKEYAEWFRNWQFDRAGMGIWKYESESRDNALIAAVSQNFGINGKNEFVRFKRDYFEKDGITLKQEYKDLGYKSMYEVFKYDEKDGPRLELQGATEQDKHKIYLRFREAVKKIRSGISGEVGAEDKSYVSTTIWGQLVMHYRSWMPGVLREKFSGISYDHRTMSAHQGRYRVVFKHLFQDTSKMDIPFTNLMLGALGRFAQINWEALYLPYAFRGLVGKEKRFQPDAERIKAEYQLWAEENPDLAEYIKEEDYLEMRTSQLRGMIMELRMVFAMAAVLWMLASLMAADDDDEDEWHLRSAYSIFRKAAAELTFTLNPTEYTRMTKNPIPLTSIPEKAFKSIGNTYDVFRDSIFGQNSPYDKSGWFHYSKSFVPGITNIGRLMEWSEEDKKYLQEGMFEVRF